MVTETKVGINLEKWYAEMEKSVALAVSEGSFATATALFLNECIGHMLPWLAVSGAVILCDLVVGIRKSLMMDEEVRFSRACRRTMGKMITYFSFVVMVAMIDVAANGGGTIDKYACLLVCFIEFTSILSNMLKPKGYDVNIIKLMAVGLSKIFKVDKEELDGVIEKKK